MGADDGGGATNKPHPAATDPKSPCDDEGPTLRPRGDDSLHHHQLPFRDARMHQVAGSEGYAVAGKILLAVAGAVAGVLLALVAVYLYNSARRRRGLGGRRRRLDRSPAIAAGDDDEAATPRGLDTAVLRALPVVVVPAGAGAGDCAVCLAELKPGEKARALPRCAHLFHADCIDAWFRGNATCPLCRADVVVVAPDAGGRAAEASAPLEVRVDVGGLRVHDHDGAANANKASVAPAMGRLPSGTDLDKTRRAFFVSTRSVSF